MSSVRLHMQVKMTPNFVFNWQWPFWPFNSLINIKYSEKWCNFVEIWKLDIKSRSQLIPNLSGKRRKSHFPFVLCHHSPLPTCNATWSKVATTTIMINITIDFYLKFRRSNPLIRGEKNKWKKGQRCIKKDISRCGNMCLQVRFVLC